MSVSPARDISQDTQYLSLLRTRDRESISLGELRRIIAFHDNFRIRLERVLLSVANETASREQMTRGMRAVNNEIARIQRFEESVKGESDPKAKIELAKNFDKDGFPLEINLSRSSRSASSRGSEPDLAAFAQRERISVTEVFQNASFDNREWLTYYEKIFASMERSARDLTMTLPSLDRLPTYFYQLAGTDTFDSLTDAQISHGISQYMSVLQETLRDLSPSSAARSAAAETVRAALLTSVDNLGRELTTRSSEANGQFRDLEKSIAAAAKSVYGHKVGAESFNYLLIVFALVFLVLMVMPRFYPEIVAVNILKSEFLLQFSTVFVLVAAIIILAIGELIAKDQLPVLLAGISGYVLGQLGKSSGSIAPENDRRGVREGATS